MANRKNSQIRVHILYLLLAFLTQTNLSCHGKVHHNSGYRDGLQIENASDTINVNALGVCEDSVITISNEVDLKGGICIIPKEFKLDFKGGLIKNGTLIGQETRIKYKGIVFDRVKISGTWNVPVISTSMFKDLGYINSLKDVVALLNPGIRNKIVIKGGNYQVSASEKVPCCLIVCSNTDMVIDGNIILQPNNLPMYAIIHVEGENISIKGKGSLIGDKQNHTGENGEWGMGINLWGAKNVSIKGFSVKNCWGDCIYIGGSSENVIIEKCTLDNGRRQGVSITSGVDVTIRDCMISNVSGTAPEYAIDVEPNSNNGCDNISIDRVKVNNCKGGFLVYGKAENAHVGSVIIRKASPSGDGKPALSIIGCDNAIIEGCTVYQKNAQRVVDCRDVKSLAIKGNTIHQQENTGSWLKKSAKKVIGRSEVGLISVINCVNSTVENNIEK